MKRITKLIVVVVMLFAMTASVNVSISSKAELKLIGCEGGGKAVDKCENAYQILQYPDTLLKGHGADILTANGYYTVYVKDCVFDGNKIYVRENTCSFQANENEKVTSFNELKPRLYGGGMESKSCVPSYSLTREEQHFTFRMRDCVNKESTYAIRDTFLDFDPVE
jgi:hypothetical protein